MNTNKTINLFNLDLNKSEHKSYCISSVFLDRIQNVNNTFIIVNISQSTVKTGHWLYIFQTVKNIEFWILFAYLMQSTRLTSRNFLKKVKNLILKKGSEYMIYQPKASVFMHCYILFFDVADILTVNFIAFPVIVLD